MSFVQYEEIEVPISQLRPGMYVCALDRPWLDTPFLIQGFTIESGEQIEQLSQYCKYVKVDKKTLNAYHPNTVNFSQASPEPKPTHEPGSATTETVLTLRQELPNARHGRHQDSHSLKQEIPLAKSAKQSVEQNLKGVYDAIKAGKQIDMATLNCSVKSMVNSITRNPDAMIWLTLLKRKGSYSYQHALGSSIWTVALGRQLGLPHEELNSLAMGGILCDIGKSCIDQKLLNKQGPLTDEEFTQVKKHVSYSVSLLSKKASPPRDVLAMVAYHHERHDGSGYPRQIIGEKIPVFARIAGLADCYDALTRPRSYADACAPAEAVKQLYDWRDRLFQAELIEEFIQSIGLYPAGSVVELTDGTVAVVIAEGRRQRLHPKVMCLLNPQKQRVDPPVIVDLAFESQEHPESAVHIKSAVAAEDYGIDLDELYL